MNITESTVSKSIWNENPTTYIVVRQTFSWILTLFYPFLYYVIFKKSPNSFGSLKWFLILHAVAITVQWVCSLIFIDFLTFVPSKITRIDGILIGIFDAGTLYKTTYIVNSVASASCLLLFCNRIFSILNMYRGIKSKLRQFFELCVYTLTCVLSLYVVFGLQIPEQASVKELTKRISPYYPNCLDDSNVIVLVPPYPEVLHKIIAFYLTYLLVMTLASIVTAQLAYLLLSGRMSNQSEKTKTMHRKFNRRTLFQVLIDTSFTSIPFTISNLATLFQWKIPELTYAVDVLSRNNPTACIIVIFVYYEPYQKYLKELVQTWLLKKNRTTAVNSVKSVDVLM